MRFVAKIHIKTKFENLQKVDATYKKFHLKHRKKKDRIVGATITAILIDVENISVSIWWPIICKR